MEGGIQTHSINMTNTLDRSVTPPVLLFISSFTFRSRTSGRQALPYHLHHSHSDLGHDGPRAQGDSNLLDLLKTKQKTLDSFWAVKF